GAPGRRLGRGSRRKRAWHDMTRRGGLTPEDRRIWARITRSVTARPGRAEAAPDAAPAPAPQPTAKAPPKFVKPAWKTSGAPPASATRSVQPRPAADALEPRRQRRL